jgi:hypothetical protein
MDRPIALEPLETLYSRCEAVTNGAHGAGWSAHAALLDRLAANQRVARAFGWTACAIERTGAGRFRAWGVPPGEYRRHCIPDWSFERE